MTTEPLVKSHRDPEHAACRALLGRGITGRVTFVHAKTGTAGLSMDIEKGAGLTTFEDERSLRIREYVPYFWTGTARKADHPSPGTTLPAEPPFAAGAIPVPQEEVTA